MFLLIFLFLLENARKIFDQLANDDVSVIEEKYIKNNFNQCNEKLNENEKEFIFTKKPSNKNLPIKLYTHSHKENKLDPVYIKSRNQRKEYKRNILSNMGLSNNKLVNLNVDQTILQTLGEDNTIQHNALSLYKK